MKRTNQDIIKIAQSIGEELNVKFNHEEFSLNGWGEVDDYAIVNENYFILLECENSQKHPNTNVLKLFPFLEENSNLTIKLYHIFLKKNKAPKNRIKLCDFVAEKMKLNFGARFSYIRIMY